MILAKATNRGYQIGNMYFSNKNFHEIMKESHEIFSKIDKCQKD